MEQDIQSTIIAKQKKKTHTVIRQKGLHWHISQYYLLLKSDIQPTIKKRLMLAEQLGKTTNAIRMKLDAMFGAIGNDMGIDLGLDYSLSLKEFIMKAHEEGIIHQSFYIELLKKTTNKIRRISNKCIIDKDESPEIYKKRLLEISSIAILPSTPRNKIPKWLKNKIFERDNNKCVCCGSANNLEIDHIIPLQKGGPSSDNLDDYQTLCQSCNSSKGHKLIKITGD